MDCFGYFHGSWGAIRLKRLLVDALKLVGNIIPVEIGLHEYPAAFHPLFGVAFFRQRLQQSDRQNFDITGGEEKSPIAGLEQFSCSAGFRNNHRRSTQQSF